MGYYQNLHLNSNQWEKEVEVVPETDEKSSSYKKVEEYRINEPSQQFKKKAYLFIIFFLYPHGTSRVPHFKDTHVISGLHRSRKRRVFRLVSSLV
jgi:hypothetical protein